MIDTRKAICIVQGFIVLTILFFQLAKYKSEKVSSRVFAFTFVNFALQISAFLILPIDLMNVSRSAD